MHEIGVFGGKNVGAARLYGVSLCGANEQPHYIGKINIGFPLVGTI